jgi:hypothetical protein
VRVERLLDRPIISANLHPSIGLNIQGPSMIRVPDWIENQLGDYYLYFADHKGRYIRVAYANNLLGPWRIYPPGSLQLEESCFLMERPKVPAEQFAQFEMRLQQSGVAISHDLLSEITTPHIASPDVHVDTTGQRIVMYFHGLELGSNLFNPNMRHSAVIKRDGELWCSGPRWARRLNEFWSAGSNITCDWHSWKEGPPTEILRPGRDWEGADAPLVPSVRSTAYGQVNQLRDPAIFEEDGRVYLLYAVAGESGIAIAEVLIP